MSNSVVITNARPAQTWMLCVLALISAGCSADTPPDRALRGTARDGNAISATLPGVFVEVRPTTSRRQDAPVALNLQRVSITDPAGFGQPLTAMTIEVPRGWQTSGSVIWNRDVECFSNMYGFQWTAISPDGLQSFSLLPHLTWQVSSATIVEMYPCPAAPMRSAREYLESVVRNARPGARVLSYRERPDLAPPSPPGNGQNANTRQWNEAGEILIGYALQGREMRESIAANVSFSEMRDPMVGVSISASAGDTVALRAPDGQLDFNLFTRIQRTMRIDPQWGQQLLAYGKQRIDEISQRQSREISNWHQRRMNEITTAGILARGKIRMETIQAVGRINNQIVASRDASGERIQAGRIDAIQEVQPWRDPTTGSQVDLSIHYQHAWQLDDGRQFMTNDPNFNPQQALGINGHELEPARQ